MTVRLTHSRRMFLRGAGGAALALPFLPSILGSQASAASAGPCVFVSLRTGHGGAWRSEFYPEDSTLTDSVGLGSLPWQARRGELTARNSDGRRSVSRVLAASSEALSDRVISAMNVMMGIDYAIYPGHNNAYHLGGYCAKLHGFDTDGSFGPTLDQILAYSPAMYSQNAQGQPEIPLPVVQTTDSIGHVRPLDPTSPVRLQRGVENRRLWAFLFQPGGAPIRDSDPVATSEMRIAAFNDVHGALARLRSRGSSPGGRLSQEDGRRVERHMDAISSLRAHFDNALTCSVENPGDDLDAIASGQAQADLTRAAVECGMSRIFSYATGGTNFLPPEVRSRWSDPHQDFIHQVSNDPRPAVEDGRADWWHLILQQAFEYSVLPLVNALDFEDAEGRNVLDSSLVMWSAEAGIDTHRPSVFRSSLLAVSKASFKQASSSTIAVRTSRGTTQRTPRCAGASSTINSSERSSAASVSRSKSMTATERDPLELAVPSTSKRLGSRASAGSVAYSDEQSGDTRFLPRRRGSCVRR